MQLVTRWSPKEIETLVKDIASGGIHPRDAKMKLAHEITSIFYGDADAKSAEETFVRMFQQKEAPDEMAEYQLQAGQTFWMLCLPRKWRKARARHALD